MLISSSHLAAGPAGLSGIAKVQWSWDRLAGPEADYNSACA